MLGIVVDFKANGVSKYIQLYEYIKQEIESGFFKSGEKLPSVRSLSKSFVISKATVENAYNQLVVEGYVESKNKSGYYVLDFDAADLGQFRKASPDVMQNNSELKINKPYNSDGTEERAFHFGEWKKSVNRILEYETKALLSYGDAQGEYPLRKEIAKFVLQSRGVTCKPDQIIIGAGIQYLFGLIAAVFKDQMQGIAFEYPGFAKGMYVFEDYGYQMEKIALEKDGIRIQALEASQANLVYVSPSHQYPTGGVMSVKKRLQLLDWAQRCQGYIIEDDYDSLLRYEGIPVPALQGLSKGENVIYVGSFSKLLIPALRISFMIIQDRLMAQVKSVLLRYSQSVSKIEQLALALYMEEGAFERHIRRIKKIYGRKNQLLIEAFKHHETDLVQLIGQESGLHVTLRFHPRVHTQSVVAQCVAMGITLEVIEGYQNEQVIVFSYSGIPDTDMEAVVSSIVRVAEESCIRA